jgi:hypothetical protein
VKCFKFFLSLAMETALSPVPADNLMSRAILPLLGKRSGSRPPAPSNNPTPKDHFDPEQSRRRGKVDSDLLSSAEPLSLALTHSVFSLNALDNVDSRLPEVTLARISINQVDYQFDKTLQSP